MDNPKSHSFRCSKCDYFISFDWSGSQHPILENVQLITVLKGTYALEICTNCKQIISWEAHEKRCKFAKRATIPSSLRLRPNELRICILTIQKKHGEAFKSFLRAGLGREFAEDELGDAHVNRDGPKEEGFVSWQIDSLRVGRLRIDVVETKKSDLQNPALLKDLEIYDGLVISHRNNGRLLLTNGGIYTLIVDHWIEKRGNLISNSAGRLLMVVQGDWEEALPCKPMPLPLILLRGQPPSEEGIEHYVSDPTQEKLLEAIVGEQQDNGYSALYSKQVVEELSTFGAQPLVKTIAEAKQLIFQSDSGLSEAQISCIECFATE